MGFSSYCMSLSLYIMSSCLKRYSVLMNLILQMHAGQRSMSGVIVVEAESFRSTCLGRDAYIHDHYLDMLITMLNSVNCSTVICSPTVENLCSREKPLVKPMAPESILIISISITFILFCYLICFYFLLCIFISKIPKIFYLSDLTLVTNHEGLANP